MLYDVVNNLCVVFVRHGVVRKSKRTESEAFTFANYGTAVSYLETVENVYGNIAFCYDS